mgnify:CR=1 FL=1
MGQLDDLETYVKELISELSDILGSLQKDITDAQKAVSFDQVKEIENAIARMQKQGLPVPSELNALKIKLLSEHDLHQARIALHRKIQERIGELLKRETLPKPKNTRSLHTNPQFACW